MRTRIKALCWIGSVITLGGVMFFLFASEIDMFKGISLLVIGTIVIFAASLLHSKDLKTVDQQKSKAAKVFGWVWIAAAPMVIGIILVFIRLLNEF